MSINWGGSMDRIIYLASRPGLMSTSQNSDWHKHNLLLKARHSGDNFYEFAVISVDGDRFRRVSGDSKFYNMSGYASALTPIMELTEVTYHQMMAGMMVHLPELEAALLRFEFKTRQFVVPKSISLEADGMMLDKYVTSLFHARPSHLLSIQDVSVGSIVVISDNLAVNYADLVDPDDNEEDDEDEDVRPAKRPKAKGNGAPVETPRESYQLALVVQDGSPLDPKQNATRISASRAARHKDNVAVKYLTKSVIGRTYWVNKQTRVAVLFDPTKLIE